MSDKDKTDEPAATDDATTAAEDAEAAEDAAEAADDPISETNATDDATFDDVPDRLADTSEPEGGDDTLAEELREARKPRRGIVTPVAWLALLLSLVAAAAAGYVVLQNLGTGGATDQNSAAIAQAAGRLDSLQASLAGLESQIGEVRTSADGLAAGAERARSSIDSVQAELENRAQLFDSLPPRMTSIERSVAALQGVSVDARNTYLVAEAEYYMQIANAQLQLAGNPYLASLALEQADDRLLQLADPALTDVRRALADERAALEVMEKPDVAGVALTLASLARVVESLPLKTAVGEAEANADAEDADLSGAARAWNSVKGAFSGLVKHTPPGDENTPLMTPEAEPLIRSNLSLQLQAARLAMLRGEQSVFEQSLDDADAWLQAYFDAQSEAVLGARQTISEIRADYSAVAPPDISGSLRLLRQYKTLAEAR